MQPPKSGKNRLFNVLKAYQAYDPATGYCQGMNFVVALLLRHIADEENAFWTLVYVMFEKNWREIYQKRSSKVTQIMRDFEEHLLTKHKQVYEHLMTEDGFSVEACFTSQIVTLFIYDCEFAEATRIFELFLIDGEQVIVDLLATIIEVKTETILILKEFELINYCRSVMVKETLREYELSQLLPKKPLVKLTPHSYPDLKKSDSNRSKGSKGSTN